MVEGGIFTLEDLVVSPITYGVVKPGDYDENGVMLIRGGDIFRGKIINDLRTISKKVSEQYQRTILRGGELLVSLVGNPGEVAIVPDALAGANLARQVGLIRLSASVHKEFVLYYLMSPQGIGQLSSKIMGSVQQVINLADLRKVEINLPSLAEQKASASVLAALDDKIGLLQSQSKTLEAITEAFFRQWFVEEVREEWGERSLLDIVRLIGGGTPKTSVSEYWGGGVCWLAGGDIANNHKSFVTDSEKKITDEGLNNSSTNLLPQFATVISARGTVGKFCLLGKPMAFSQSNYGIMPRIDGCYFFTHLLINHAVDELQSSAYGSVFDTITTTTFKDVKLSLPDDSLILEFEELVTPYFKKMLLNKQQVISLGKLRNTLLPKLMSGEVRVAI